MADDITLFPGATGDEESGEGWLPALVLQQEGNELHVVVGETVEGMAEGVSAELFEEVRKRLLTDDDARVLYALWSGDLRHKDERLGPALEKLLAIIPEDLS